MDAIYGLFSWAWRILAACFLLVTSSGSWALTFSGMGNMWQLCLVWNPGSWVPTVPAVLTRFHPVPGPLERLVLGAKGMQESQECHGTTNWMGVSFRCFRFYTWYQRRLETIEHLFCISFFAMAWGGPLVQPGYHSLHLNHHIP